MVVKLKLKILALGTELMLRQLENQLDSYEVSIFSYCEYSAIADLLKKEQFDLVIIDNRVKDVETICHEVVRLAAVPVAVMLREQMADWKQLSKLEVDCYLAEEAGRDELGARIKACSRRKPAQPHSEA